MSEIVIVPINSSYKVADTFDWVVDIYIEIDFIFNDITAQIVVAKSPLMRFVATFIQRF